MVELDAFEFDLLLLSETWRGEKEEHFTTVGGHKIFLSGGSPGRRGVGICIAKKVVDKINGVESSRACTPKNGGPHWAQAWKRNETWTNCKIYTRNLVYIQSRQKLMKSSEWDSHQCWSSAASIQCPTFLFGPSVRTSFHFGYNSIASFFLLLADFMGTRFGRWTGLWTFGIALVMLCWQWSCINCWSRFQCSAWISAGRGWCGTPGYFRVRKPEWSGKNVCSLDPPKRFVSTEQDDGYGSPSG